MYEERSYRNLVNPVHLTSFRVVVQETDLQVHADGILYKEARDLILQYRGQVEAYIQNYPEFLSTHSPWPMTGPAPEIVVDMINAAARVGVGPMAAIAGAIAEQVGRGLLNYSDQVVVENGGDVFMQTNRPVTVGIFAGPSPLSMRIGLQLGGNQQPVAVCTSSGTVGHSFSLGKADAVCVVAECCALADAAATSIANRIGSPADIDAALNAGKHIKEINGLVIVVADRLGVWGQLEVVPLIHS